MTYFMSFLMTDEDKRELCLADFERNELLLEISLRLKLHFEFNLAPVVEKDSSSSFL